MTATKKRAPRKTADEITDGTIEIVLKDGPNKGKSWKLDVFSTILVIEDVEKKHGATAKKTDWVTPQFFSDLAEKLGEVGLDYCTPTMAFMIRDKIKAAFEALKKNMS